MRELREERARGRELQGRLDELSGARRPPPPQAPELFDISDPQMLAPVSVVPTSAPHMVRI